MNSSCDIVVVGGGMVGAALACALADQGRDVSLIEPQPPIMEVDDAAPWSLRVSALNPASQRLLDRLGAWSLISPQRIAAYRRMTVWNEQGEIHFDQRDAGRYGAQQPLGYIVENLRVQLALWQQVARRERIRVVQARSSALQLEPHTARVSLDNGELITASLVVGADGADSAIRRFAGIGATSADYGQRGLVATVRAEVVAATAWQRFTDQGPLAFLPLADGAYSIVWSLPSQQAERYLRLAPEALGELLSGASQERLGRVSLLGSAASFPLRRLDAQQYIDSRLALVGDAAHAIHPLAGQGVNLGFADVVALSQTLAGQHEVGRWSALRRYERERRSANRAMMRSMDALYQLFITPHPVLSWMRNQGLSWVDKMAPLKRLFMAQAMGERDAPLRTSSPEQRLRRPTARI